MSDEGSDLHHSFPPPPQQCGERAQSRALIALLPLVRCTAPSEPIPSTHYSSCCLSPRAVTAGTWHSTAPYFSNLKHPNELCPTLFTANAFEIIFFPSLTFSVDININKQKYFVEVANWRTKRIHQMIAVLSEVIFMSKQSHTIEIKLWC